VGHRLRRFNFLDDRQWQISRLSGLSNHWQSFAIASLISFPVLTSSYALAAYRVHEASDLDDRAEIRLRASEEALSKSRLAWEDLRNTLRIAKRLRAVRLSGSLVMLQLTSIAERLPSGVWLDSFSQSADGLELDGQTKSLGELAHVSDILSEVSPSTQMRSIARHGESDSLAFHIQPQDPRR
jgi:Fimbrial assembly protein (PilN)